METVIEHFKRIEQIDQIANEAIKAQYLRMPEKYASIEATLKLLLNIITALKKRSYTYEHELKSRAKIGDLTDQIRLHRARITDCERLSQSLKEKLIEKGDILDASVKKVRDLRA